MRIVSRLVMAVLLALPLLAEAQIYNGEEDIAVSNGDYAGYCEEYSQPYHGAAVEVAAFDNGSQGDIYAIAYRNTSGGVSFTKHDTRLGTSAVFNADLTTAGSLNRAGHTDSCISGNYPNRGCAWITGSDPSNNVFYFRELADPSGAGFGVDWLTGLATGMQPAGDAGYGCLVSTKYGCLSYGNKLLLVYVSPNQTQLKAQFRNTAGALIGSELTLVSAGVQIARPQVAWLAAESKWLVAYQDAATYTCPPIGSPNPHLRTMVVNWNGTYASPVDLGPCGGICGGQCGAMSLAASVWGTPNQFMLHQKTTDYLLTNLGNLVSSWIYALQEDVWAPTDSSYGGVHYQFQKLLQNSPVHRYAYPAISPWGSIYDGGAVSLGSAEHAQAIRRGSITTAHLFQAGAGSCQQSGGKSLYLSITQE